jgi:hypothetical protein
MRKRNLDLMIYLRLHALITAHLLRKRSIPTASLNAAVTWLRRLRERNIVRSTRLYGKRKCYVLTGYGTRLLRKHGLHVSRKAHLPLSPQAKKEYFAINLFCNEQERSTRTLYRPYYDAEAFPRIAQMKSDPFHKKRFVRDGETLHLFFVDRGTPQFLNESVIPKVCTLLDPIKYPEFVQLLNTEKFRLAIATGTEARGDELLLGLQNNPPPLAAEVIVYPELVHFLPQLAQPIA